MSSEKLRIVTAIQRFIFDLCRVGVMPITESHPEIAIQWHHTLNGDKKPEDYTSGSNYEPYWLCDMECPQGCPHIWKTSIGNRCLRRSNCPYCKNLKRCVHTSIMTTHPEIAKQWHPTKNGNQKPSDYHFGSGVKIWWLCGKTCPKGCVHEWPVSIRDRCELEHGCPCCSRRQNTCIHTSIVTTHPEVAKQWHPTKNGDRHPSEFSSGSQFPAWWTCENTCSEGCIHEWNTTIQNRCKVNGTNCPYFPCLYRQPQKCCPHTSIETTHPDIADEWDTHLNGENTPSQFTRGSGFIVWWKCLNGHKSYKASIDHRCSRGDGCSCCYLKTEGKICRWLDFWGIKYELRFTLPGMIYKRQLYFDIYLPDFKIILEIDGEHHFRPVSGWKSDYILNRQKDIFKMQYAHRNQLRVIRIYQPDVWNNPVEWIDNHVLRLIRDSSRDNSYIASVSDIYSAHIALYISNPPPLTPAPAAPPDTP